MTGRSFGTRFTLLALAGLALAATGLAQDVYETRYHDLRGMATPLPSSMVDGRHEAVFHPIGLYRSQVQLITDGDMLQTENDTSASGEVSELLESLFPLPTDGPDHVILDVGGKIRVTGTQDFQRRVAAAIDAIAELRHRQVELSVRQVTIRSGPLDDEVRSLLIRAAAGRLSDTDLVRLDELDVHDGARSGTIDAPAGMWASFERTSFTEHLADFDVEIAQDSSIADPIMHRATEGARAAVRAFPTEDGRVLLRVVGSCGDLVHPIRNFNTNASGLGTLELPDLSASLESTDLLVRPGETVGVVTGTLLDAVNGRWDVLLLRVVSVTGTSRRETLQLLPLGALTSNDPLRLVGFDVENDIRSPGWVLKEEEASAPVAADQVEEQLNYVDLAAVEEGRAIHYYTASSGVFGLLMHGKVSHLDAVRDRLLALERTELRSALVTVRIEGPTGTIGLITSRVLVGRPAGLACQREIAYIRDADVEVAEKARISDPIVGIGTAGLMTNVQVRSGPGDTFDVALDLRLDTLLGEPRQIVHSADNLSQVEAISVGTRRYSGRMRLQPGRTRELDLGGNPFGDEQTGKLKLMVTVDPQE